MDLKLSIQFEEFVNDLEILGSFHNGSDRLYLDAFISYHAATQPSLIAMNHYTWMVGNILHYLTIIFLAPQHIYHPFTKPLSKPQAREALFLIYKLIHIYKVPLDEKDMENRTPLDLAKALCSDPNNELIKLYQDAHVIKYRQVFLVKRFLCHKRRKHAAKIICNRVFEYVMNPDTPVGMRLLAKRAERFQKLVYE